MSKKIGKSGDEAQEGKTCLTRMFLSAALAATPIFAPTRVFALGGDGGFSPLPVVAIMACAGALTLVMLVRRRDS